jgi:chromosome partitioning protein
MDCPPSLGLLTLNALIASHSLLIPVQSEYYALEGLTELFKTLQAVQQGFNPGLALEGVVLTMFDTRTALCHQVEAEVRKYYGEYAYKNSDSPHRASERSA